MGFSSRSGLLVLLIMIMMKVNNTRLLLLHAKQNRAGLIITTSTDTMKPGVTRRPVVLMRNHPLIYFPKKTFAVPTKPGLHNSYLGQATLPLFYFQVVS